MFASARKAIGKARPRGDIGTNASLLRATSAVLMRASSAAASLAKVATGKRGRHRSVTGWFAPTADLGSP